ncbi:hypothetical protein [Pantoea agglomerans]|uniref:Uncharacterized protein n=1 Tax=Enterobacter agglomerans TaxID=549 RepID=A0AAN2FHE2_ENTAG|nr:hypothetical protein [Pantoea agglomerans]CAH6375643.1 hypothetical protein DAPPPG734_23995 [Pantoea agglomerans]
MRRMIVQPHPAGAASPVKHEDIARALGRYCLIRLDNGAESFWHNGHYICEADGASAEAGVADIARLAARAGGQSLRHAELPVPDGEWCWSDIAERLARSALTETVRASGIVTGCDTAQGRGVHFCDHPLLSGDNSNLWFPVGSEESWFEAVERILIMNGLAENLVNLTPLREGNYIDWKATWNRRVII